jgi:hypothetical protein
MVRKTHPQHGGCRRLTAAMVPRPRRRCAQQSANMMRNNSMSLKLEDIIVFTIFVSSVKARRVVDALCLRLLIAAAASGQFWPAKSCSNPSLYL